MSCLLLLLLMLSKLWSSQLWTQFKQLRIEAWKSQDFNGVIVIVIDVVELLDFRHKHFSSDMALFMVTFTTGINGVLIGVWCNVQHNQRDRKRKLDTQRYIWWPWTGNKRTPLVTVQWLISQHFTLFHFLDNVIVLSLTG